MESLRRDMRIKFNRDLKALKDNIVRLGSMVDTAIQKSTDALRLRSNDLAQEVILDDTQINDLRFEIEEACLKLIAQQQPMAGDLRIIVSVMNVILDLERMGDHAAANAKLVFQLAQEAPLNVTVDLPKMAQIGREMLRQSIEAFVQEDNNLAQNVVERDDSVDMLYNQVFRDLVNHMIEEPSTITRGMCLLFAAHNLERIADRATNICERVHFRTTGRMEEIPSEWEFEGTS